MEITDLPNRLVINRDWSPESVYLANSVYYPLCPSGPLCPLLDDGDLLFDFYTISGFRQQIKGFCKSKPWGGKPKLPFSMTDKHLKLFLLSLFNSPDARQLLSVFGKKHELCHAIWNWLKNTNAPLYDMVLLHCYEKTPGVLYIKPGELGRFIEMASCDDSPTIRNSLIYLALAFAMLDDESCVEIISIIAVRYPESAYGLGLICESVEQLQEIPEPTAEPEFEAAMRKPHLPPIPDVDAEISQSISICPVDCWVRYVDELIHKTEVLGRSHELFVKNAKELSSLHDLESFVDSGDAVSLLSSLELERVAVQHKNHDVQSFLTSRCKYPDSNECDLLKLLRQITKSPTASPTELFVKVGELRKKADDLLENAQSSRLELKELKSNEADLRELIGFSDQGKNQPERNETPCETLAAVSDGRKRVAELRLKFSIAVDKRREELLAECDQLNEKFNLDADKKLIDCLATYIDLRACIVSAEDFEQIKNCVTILAQLEMHCVERGNSSLRNLVKRLNGDVDEFSVFLDICRTLIDQRDPEIAMLLLHLRQNSHPYEEIFGNTDRALSLLLETACELASCELPLATVLSTLCEEPWLLSMGHDDIESSDLHERLVIALLGMALGGAAECAANILVNIGAAELSRHSLPRVLYEVLQAVVSRREIQIVSASQLAARSEQERSILEKIAFEGSRYRHIQCGKAPHFAHFEATQVFPALTALWNHIVSDLKDGRFSIAFARVESLDVNDWYDDLNSKRDKPVVDHPHYSKMILDFMRGFLSDIQEHLTYCEKIWGTGQLVLTEEELRGAIRQWEGTQKSRSVLASTVTLDLDSTVGESIQATPLWEAISRCESVILRCPHFVTWLVGQKNPQPGLMVEKLVLDDLMRDFQFDEVVRILTVDLAWRQLSVIHRNRDPILSRNWMDKYDLDVTELASRRNEVIATNTPSIVESFDVCISNGSITAARQILRLCEQLKEHSRVLEKEAVSSFVSEQLERINVTKDEAAEANMAEAWQEDVFGFAVKIEIQLRNLRRSEEPANVISAVKTCLESAVDALIFVVRQNSNVFDEVTYHLSHSQIDSGLLTTNSIDHEQAQNKCPDIHKCWSILASADFLDEKDSARAWAQFVKAFGKICNLYHDESDDKKRFLTVPSITYPFVVYHTAFYQPQSEFLKRPLRLYLYRERDVDKPALQRLEAELCGDNSTARLHVVFAPQGLDVISRFFKYDKGFKNFVIIGERFLDQLSIVDKHDVPVRQALHSSVSDLASSSPFVAQGYCHQRNNIYVGRKDILQKILNTPQAMIWGGRRIGKTSVLHALENALGNKGFVVAYVYVDLEDNGDPDLSIAQKIAATLGLEEVKSITDFERQVTALRNNGSRLAFLVDEVDEYIKKSREVHGDAFPLATVLRQLVMDDAAKDTILVYSGYHQLYFEAKLNKRKRRVGHPFINIAQDIPIRDLTHDDISQLVKTGFEEMLGIRVSPEVPPQISKRASGHPAFVQQFCRCLLERVSKRRSPGTPVAITKDDVEAVYAADVSSEGGEQPFIFYVNETLGYNLSHLGRAIMVSICRDPHREIQAENEDRFFSINKIREELNLWCELIGVRHPEIEHFQQTIDLLVMTNMLTQNPQEHGKYRVTYPTYIDILRRLDNLRKADVEDSLKEYDSKERTNGVLL